METESEVMIIKESEINPLYDQVLFYADGGPDGSGIKYLIDRLETGLPTVHGEPPTLLIAIHQYQTELTIRWGSVCITSRIIEKDNWVELESGVGVDTFIEFMSAWCCSYLDNFGLVEA